MSVSIKTENGIIKVANVGGSGGASSAEDISFDNSEIRIEATNVQDAIEEVFQSVSNGKELIADAITDKGVETSATDTFETMATNISQISSGKTYTTKKLLLQETTQHNTRNATYTYNYTATADGAIQLVYYDWNNGGAKWEFTIKDSSGNVKSTTSYTKIASYGHTDATNLVELNAGDSISCVFSNVKDDGTSTYIRYLTVFYYT